MNLEDKLTVKIESLKAEIKKCNTQRWQERTTKGADDTNGYYWNFLGGCEEANGKLDGFKEALEIVKRG